MKHTFLAKIIYKGVPTVLSIVLHPLLMPTLGILIIFNSGTYISMMPMAAKNIVIIIVLTCTFGLPLAFIPLYYYQKIITSIGIKEKQERIIPLSVTALFYYFSFYLLRHMGAPALIQAFLFASTIVVCLNLLITIRWKISAHMMGIGGVTGLVVAMSILYKTDMTLFLIALIFLSGLIGFARLSLNTHTPAQVYTGLFIGFTTMMLILFLY
jgi:hypothetical protein